MCVVSVCVHTYAYIDTHYSQTYVSVAHSVLLYTAVPLLNVGDMLQETNMYAVCNRRNGPDFGRVFLRTNYTDITQNTYIQSSMVTEILAREI